MAIQVECQGCGKSIAAPEKYAGKKVKCRCGAVFIVPSAAAPPSSAGALLDMLPEDLTSGPTIESPGENASSACGDVLSAGQPIIPRGKARHRSSSSRNVFGRLRKRKLATAVAVFALVLTVAFLFLSYSLGMRWYLAVPPIVGGGLAALGFRFQIIVRHGRRVSWVDPSAARIATFCGVLGLFLAGLIGLMYLAGRSGHPILTALGLSPDLARTLGWFNLVAVGLCFAVCFLVIFVSVVGNLVRKYGLLGAAEIIYLCLACPLIVFLAVQCSHEIVNQARLYRHKQIARRMQESSRKQISDSLIGSPHNRRPASAPRRKPRKIHFPPGATDPQHPDFYRVNLAELRSDDSARRRLALMRLVKADPKELRDEITEVLKSLLDDPKFRLRGYALKAFCRWSADDTLPIVIRALDDDNFSVKNSALDILGERKDPRAIEPLVILLLKPYGFRVASCLEKMGPMVEDPLLEHIDTCDEMTRSSIIRILRTVGTKKSLTKLREIAAGDDLMAANSARHALRDIERRAD